MSEDIPVCPAPWTLNGWGLINTWLGKTAREAAVTTLSDSQRAAYAGGPVVLMLVRYADSDCGPYDELLFIPGRLPGLNGPRPVISRIWVSTQASVENGRRNWAIPKELAEFDFSADERGRQTCSITADGLAADLEFRGRRGAMPVTTRLLPGSVLTLRQPSLPEQNTEAPWCETTVSATGRARLARCDRLQLGGDALPNGLGQPSISLLSENFTMVFPESRFSPD